jgi:hypothetical protein
MRIAQTYDSDDAVGFGVVKILTISKTLCVSFEFPRAVSARVPNAISRDNSNTATFVPITFSLLRDITSTCGCLPKTDTEHRGRSAPVLVPRTHG